MSNIFDRGVRVRINHGMYVSQHGEILGTVRKADGTEWLEVLVDGRTLPIRCRTYMVELEKAK